MDLSLKNKKEIWSRRKRERLKENIGNFPKKKIKKSKKNLEIKEKQDILKKNKKSKKNLQLKEKKETFLKKIKKSKKKFRIKTERIIN